MTIRNQRSSMPAAVRDLHGAKAPGFTLIELLVVVSIIALLISILLPSLRSARDQAKLTKCVAHMRGIGQSAAVFAGDHKDRIQVATDEVGLAKADPNRTIYEYGSEGELLSWPVALAQYAGVGYRNNWEWGVRAMNFKDARSKRNTMDQGHDGVLCPSDRVQIATPYYPRDKSQTFEDIDNAGLKGDGDPQNPVGGSEGMSYWGKLSYAISEDVAGVEVAESAGNPACWRAGRRKNGNWKACRGEFAYSDNVCVASGGWRLQGRLEKVYGPSDVGLIYEAGRDDSAQGEGGLANLVLSALTEGPYLGDFQQFHEARLPSKRHPKGKLSVLFADFHGESVRPVNFNPENELPTEYSPRVRVSPYQAHPTRR